MKKAHTQQNLTDSYRRALATLKFVFIVDKNTKQNQPPSTNQKGREPPPLPPQQPSQKLVAPKLPIYPGFTGFTVSIQLNDLDEQRVLLRMNAEKFSWFHQWLLQQNQEFHYTAYLSHKSVV